MTLEEVATRLEDLAVEEDMPELQGLANELSKLSGSASGVVVNSTSMPYVTYSANMTGITSGV